MRHGGSRRDVDRKTLASGVRSSNDRRPPRGGQRRDCGRAVSPRAPPRAARDEPERPERKAETQPRLGQATRRDRLAIAAVARRPLEADDVALRKQGASANATIDPGRVIESAVEPTLTAPSLAMWTTTFTVSPARGPRTVDHLAGAMALHTLCVRSSRAEAATPEKEQR